MHSGVYPSLHANCHHRTVFKKFKLNFFPPPCQRLVRHHQQANTNLLKHAIGLLDWQKCLSNLDVNEQVSLFIEMIMNIFENFIPYETVTNDIKNKQISNTYCEQKTL